MQMGPTRLLSYRIVANQRQTPRYLLTYSVCATNAGVAELVDALDLGSSEDTREGSSPFARTTSVGKEGTAHLPCRKRIEQWRNLEDYCYRS